MRSQVCHWHCCQADQVPGEDVCVGHLKKAKEARVQTMREVHGAAEPTQPSSMSGSIQIFACQPCGFVTSRPDAEHKKTSPVCPRCGKLAIHSSPATAQQIIHEQRLQRL